MPNSAPVLSSATRRRAMLRPAALMLALAAVFGAVLTTAAPQTAQAQATTDYLANNTDQPDGAQASLLAHEYAVGFTLPGTTSEEVYIVSIGVDFGAVNVPRNPTTGGIDAYIYENVDGAPGGVPIKIRGPVSPRRLAADSLNEFMATTVEIQGGTEYFLVIASDRALDNSLQLTDSADDSGLWPGSGIADSGLRRTRTVSGNTVTRGDWEAMSGVIKFRIIGRTAEETLVTNLGQPASPDPAADNPALSSYDYAQAFTTGPSSAGYTLTQVRVGYAYAFGRDPNPYVSIWTDDNGAPGTSLTGEGGLNHPLFFRLGLNEYRADPYINLEPRTTYWFVIENSKDNDNGLQITRSGSEDSTTLSGWSIADTALRRRYTTHPDRSVNTRGDWASAGNHAMQLRIEGYVRPAAASPPGPPTLPAAPAVAVSPVAGSTTELAVSWDSVEGAELYRVERKTGSGDYSTVTRDDDTALTETLTGLAAGTSYTVRVTAVDTDADPDADLVSGEGAGATLAAMGTLTVSAVGEDTFTVSWPAVSGATGYVVEHKTGSGDYSAVARSDDTALTETVTGLTSETAYTVRVTARHLIDGADADGDSATAEATTAAAAAVTPTPTPTTVPGDTVATMGAVTLAAVGDSTTQLEASWTAVTGAVGYRVEFKQTGNPFEEVDRADDTATTETFTGLVAETEYRVRVTVLRTVDGQTVDGGSVKARATTPTGPEPELQPGHAPALNIDSSTVNGIWLDWKKADPIDGADITHYTVQWSPKQAGPYSDLHYPVQGFRGCVSKLPADSGLAALGHDQTRDLGCWFQFVAATSVGDVANGELRYYRLIAHAGSADSPPGPLMRYRLGAQRAEVGGL